MAPDVIGFGGPPSKKRRVSPDGEVAATIATTATGRRRKLPPIARQHVSSEAAPVLPADFVEPLFEQSIALILRSCGFDSGSKLALNSIRYRAGEYIQQITSDAMLYTTTQRRTRPAITDFEETLKKTGYSAADLEDEIIRYRRSKSTSTPIDETPVPLNEIPKSKPHIYALPEPDPAPPEEPPLQELLGPELLKPRKRYKVPIPARPSYMTQLEHSNPDNPRFAAPTKPSVSVHTERPYIDPHHPPWPGKHTYERHQEEQEVVRDAKKIRELASEEARQSGETLRKLLAEFSKVSSTRKAPGEVNGGGAGTGKGGRRGGSSYSDVYRGGNARQQRDTVFEKTWEKVIKAMEAEKDKEKAAREEKRRQKREQREKANSGVNGLFGSSAMEIDFDGGNDSSEDEESPNEVEREQQIDEKGLLDTVVNCEKGLWAKGGMRRVMIR
ncbi:hypothetical protein ABW21_db0203818 [Orbilia brochopaga]|nr:hypothetical protein ABW21_db0203818 [Drechslerella brochopaga]